MHVDAFFEYLLDNPHPYWTDIPSVVNPVSEGGRDGVAAEDDMALRSLLPHIRPRRGRKRPDDESLSRSPSQKPKMEPGGDHSNIGGHGGEQLGAWTSQSDTRSGAYLFAQDQFTRMNTNLGNTGAWTGEEFAHTPMTANNYSSIDPTTANAFWVDQLGEPQSVTTPPKPKTNRRHGAKVVSSAWRGGGPGGSGKTRGRPPLHRQQTNTSQTQSDMPPATASFSTFPPTQSVSLATTFRQPPQQHEASPHIMDASLAYPIVTLGSAMPGTTITSAAQHGVGMQQPPPQGYESSRHQHSQPQMSNLRTTRSRLSLQVPERTGTDVRLAMPQSQQASHLVMLNEAATTADDPALAIAHQHQEVGAGIAGMDMHMMDPFGSGIAQGFYNMQFRQQQQQQQQHPHHQIRQLPHTSQDTASIYSTTTTNSHQAQHQSSPPRTLFQQPDAGDVSTGDVSTASHVTIDHGESHLTDPTDRANVDGVESFLVYELLGSEWCDAQGNAAPGAGVEEATALAEAIVHGLRRKSDTARSFLMNLAALTGPTWLRQDGERTRVLRMGQGQAREPGTESYEVHWNLEFGDARSSFSLREVVVRNEGWAGSSGTRETRHGGGGGGGVGGRQVGEEDAEGEDEDANSDESHEDDGEGGDAERWRQRYRGLLDVVQAQRADMSHLRRGVLDLCRARPGTGPGEGDDAVG